MVDAGSAEIWKNSVPLVSIRSLLRDKNYQQSLDDGTWGRELVTWDGHPEFEDGMFVARVLGDAMEPTLQAGSYCLSFRSIIQRRVSVCDQVAAGLIKRRLLNQFARGAARSA